MIKILNRFFVSLGIIFLIIIMLGVYVYVADPYNLKPLFLSSDTTTPELVDDSSLVEVEDKNPLLNDTQEKTLKTFGIDPASLPSTISAEQEACFINILGDVRVNEIKAGATPSAQEFFAARECL